jgi:hypothetical protein
MTSLSRMQIHEAGRDRRVRVLSLANLPVGRQVCPKIPPLFLAEGVRGSLDAPSFNSPGPSFKKRGESWKSASPVEGEGKTQKIAELK